MKRLLLSAMAVSTMLSFASAHAQRGGANRTDEVRAAETAFAKSMADRSLSAFTALLAEDAVFFAGKGVFRGKAEVVAGWKRYFDGPTAPFSWAPAEVEVLASGDLGYTSGPVYDSQGNRFGTFNSVWKRQPDGSWKIVFDKGCPPCDCGAK